MDFSTYHQEQRISGLIVLRDHPPRGPWWDARYGRATPSDLHVGVDWGKDDFVAHGRVTGRSIYAARGLDWDWMQRTFPGQVRHFPRITQETVEEVTSNLTNAPDDICGTCGASWECEHGGSVAERGQYIAPDSDTLRQRGYDMDDDGQLVPASQVLQDIDIHGHRVVLRGTRIGRMSAQPEPQ